MTELLFNQNTSSPNACLELLSSNLLPRLFPHSSQLLEVLHTRLSTARSLQKSLETIILDDFCSETEKVRLDFILLLNKLSGYSVQIVVFCLSQKQLDGVASGSIKFPKSLVENVATISVANQAVPVGSKAAWLQLRRRLFALEPTSFLCGLARSGVLPSPAGQRTAVVAVLGSATERLHFDISKESIRSIVGEQGAPGSGAANLLAVAGVPQSQWPLFREYLFRLQKLQGLVSEPEDISALWDAGYNSAEDLVKQGSSAVETIVRHGVPRDRADKIYNHAGVVAVRNEGILTAALSSRGVRPYSVLSAVGGAPTMGAAFSKGPDQQPPLASDINFTAMFGLETMGCDECGSATGPSAYFVDLLQALKGIQLPDGSTLLDKLFSRRPDLGNLQLSCANTEVLIPYIDLVNEMMESVLWHLSQGGEANVAPDAFDMDENSSSGECVAQPSNVDFRVYSEIIQPMVYPMHVFPYNQATTSTRAFFRALGSSLYQYLSTFCSANAISSSLTEARDVLTRALAAETLGLQHEDFVAICGEGIYSLEYFRKDNSGISQSEYGSLIGLMPVSEYWGYKDDTAMLAADRGLTLIKDQLLPRSGLEFADLLSILRSQFISGRLVIESASPKAGGPEFSGSLMDMRLRELRPDGTTSSLQPDICGQLQAFFRLRRKLQWTVHDLDAITVTLGQNGASAINATLLVELAAVKRLAESTDTSPAELQPFWGNMDIHGRGSLYSRRFPGDPLQIKTSDGKAAASTISSRMESILPGLGITGTELKAILSTKVVPDRLSLANLSAIYRISLLCRMLDVSVAAYEDLLSMYPGGFDPFESPTATQDLVQRFTTYTQTPQPWSFDQLLFVIRGTYSTSDSSCNLVIDDVVLIATEIFTNLDAASSSTQLDLYADDAILIEHVNQLTSQLFGVENGRRISNFLVNFESSTESERVFFQHCLITILNPEGTTELLRRISDQRGDNPGPARFRCFFKTIMTVIIKGRQQQIVIDSLRTKFPDQELSILHYALTEVIQLAPEMSPGDRSLVSGMEAMILAAAHSSSQNEGFEGYFTPPCRGAYIIACNPDKKPADLFVDGIKMPFTNAGANSLWTTVTHSLMANRSYQFSYTGDIRDLRWSCQQAVGVPAASFSNNILIPQFTALVIETVISKLMRFFLAVGHFQLEMPEIAFWQLKQTFNFNALSLDDVWDLGNYGQLKQTFSKAGATQPLITLYQWISLPETKRLGSLSALLSAVTAFPLSVCRDFLQARYPEAKETDSSLLLTFQSVEALVEMRDILRYVDRLGLGTVPLGTLFSIALPPKPPTVDIDFANADIIRNVVKSRWATRTTIGDSSSPLVTANDQIRDSSRAALVHCLLSQKYALRHNLSDADKLFGHFLIDVQMGPALKTSRTKQAISTVQLFVQRCMLGVEKDNGIPSTAILVRSDWEYMLQYRIWEANRKAFLYPENWIDPTLRDDKTEQFLSIESALAQTKLNTENITSIVKGFVHSVNEIADLQVEAYLWDRKDKGDLRDSDNYKADFHFFGRTRTSPPLYYYRKMELGGSAANIIAYWSPWTKLDIDVSVYEGDDDGKKLPRPGSYMTPVVFNSRLFVFLPEITLGQNQGAKAQMAGTYESWGKKSVSDSQPDHQWEIRLGFIENRNGKWSPKSVCQSTICVPADNQALNKKLPDISSFKFWPRARALGKSNAQVLVIAVERLDGTQSSSPDVSPGSTSYPSTRALRLGEFEMRGQQLVLVGATGNGMPVPSLIANNSSSGLTLPTAFGKLSWAVPVPKQAQVPNNRVVSSYQSINTKPLLPRIGADRRSSCLYSWTLSFDNVNHPAPTGFVFDFSTSDAVSSHFAYPPQYCDPEHPEDIVWETDTFSDVITPQFVERMSWSDGLSVIYEQLSKLPRELHFDAFGQRNSMIFHERSTPFAIYNWELGVHIPSLLMERLIATQQLDLALLVARLVFDPTMGGDRVDRCWSFPPFRDERIRTGKGPDWDLSWKKKLTADEWRDSKSNVHAAARGNPAAYMKRIAMKYVEILIAAGDEYFRRNTLESVPLAIQRYSEASNVFGPAPVELPPLGKRTVKSYNQIASGLDAFSNAQIDIELEFPFYSEPSQRGNSPAKGQGPLGFIRSGYFSIPGNPQLVALRATIDDRLYKIRNGMDINGKMQILPLFEPPIDPGMLVRAGMSAGGTGMAAFLAGMESPMPTHRFRYILQRAFELTAELKSSAQHLLSIRERKDAEALMMLRSNYRNTLLGLVKNIKEAQKHETEKAIESLEESRKAQEMRLRYYLDLTGDSKEVPSSGGTWQDIGQTIEAPTKDDYRMTANEQAEMDKADTAMEFNLAAGVIESAAAGVFAIPTFTTKIQPLGVGMDISVGGSNIGQVLLCVSGALKTKAQYSLDQGAQAARKAALMRQLQERRLAANTIGREIMKTDKDVAQLRARLATCDAELEAQQHEMESALAEEKWLRSKYSNQQLYTMLESSLNHLFHQTYQLASDMARTAQRALNFEHAMRFPNTISTAQPSLGQIARDDLFAGEALYLDLKRMEMMYMSNRPHDFEIQKTVSLRQLNPWALLTLRETGTADFDLPELFFDIDFPGHYCRRIASVSLSMPCIVGPYVSLNTTLSLRSHKYRISAINRDAADYAAADDAKFRTDRVPITSIAIGSGSPHQSGVFDLGFNSNRGESYGPFEGAGAVSSWRLRLPDTLRPFDYDTMTDVLLHLRYTAVDGGDALGRAAQEAAQSKFATAASSPLAVAIDLRSDFPVQWNGFRSAGEMALPAVDKLLPFWTNGAKVVANKISLLLYPEPASHPKNVTVSLSDKVSDLAALSRDGAPSMGKYYVLSSQEGTAIKLGTLGQIKGVGATSVERGWLVIGYSVTRK
ncbi:hypothetical protein F5X98DRAFT_381291 [Xylaria grammica]|nr:hypothetical protein F5X98DRAFT_381291 [Xylaria grammica]